MSRRAETVTGFSRNHQTMIIVARVFAGFGWIISFGGLVACVFTWSGASIAIVALISDGFNADVPSLMTTATPFFSAVTMIITGLIVVSFSQVMRVISSIEANSQASFLLLDRRLPNPHPDADTFAGLNDHGMGSIPM